MARPIKSRHLSVAFGARFLGSRGGLIASAAVFSLSLSACVPIRNLDPAQQERALGLVDQAVLLMRQGELDRAEAAFQVSRDLVPGAAASDGLGCVALLKGENEQAERFFHEALEADFRYTQALGNLALLYEQLGHTEKAEAYYRQALEQDPGNFRIRNNYAIFLAQRKGSDDPEVIRQLLRAAVLENSTIIEGNLEKISERKK